MLENGRQVSACTLYLIPCNEPVATHFVGFVSVYNIVLEFFLDISCKLYCTVVLYSLSECWL